MNAARRQQWISGCEEQIASLVKDLTWGPEDDECIVVLRELVMEWAEACAS